MLSFSEFLTEGRKKARLPSKHIHEFNHHAEHLRVGEIKDYITEALSPEESEEKVRQKLAPSLKKFHEHYGPADPTPAPHRELKARIEARFDQLSKMSPQEQKREFAAANKRQKESGIGPPVASNDKTDTAAEIPTKKGKNGQIPLGMSFAPDHAKHYVDPEGKKAVSRNVCAGSTSSCRSACLAKHGNYGFIANRASIAGRTQRLTHNEAATHDHATLVYAKLKSASEQAAKEGKSVLMRGSVTDDTGADLHHDAIKKHFPHVEQMGYTKKSGTRHDPENGIHTIYSDSGPMVRRDPKTGKVSLERENIQRRKVLENATRGNAKRPGMNSYVVFNKKRPSATASEDKVKDYKEKLGSIKTIRRYDVLPSKPKEGEKSAYHHEDGYGRVEHNGQSYRYQDHPVADKIKDVHGNEKFPAEHDSRNTDTSSRTYKTPEGHKVGHVVTAFATASTSNHDLHSSGFFHHFENVDHEGVYHDGHPAEMEKAGFKGLKSDGHKALVKAPTGVKSGLKL